MGFHGVFMGIFFSSFVSNILKRGYFFLIWGKHSGNKYKTASSETFSPHLLPRGTHSLFPFIQYGLVGDSSCVTLLNYIATLLVK